MNKIKFTAVFAAGLLTFSLFSSVFAADKGAQPVTAEKQQVTEGEKAGWQSLQISAPSAILVEASTGRILYEKDPDKQLEPASVTKVMTLLLIMEAIKNGEINYETMITTSEKSASMGGSQIWLKVGESMSVHDMLKAICIVSANDCSYAMAEHLEGSGEAFVAKMNERAKELGCTGTNFVNPTGLPAGGHVTTVHDLALMSRELIKHKEIREFTLTWMDSLRGGASELTNTNKLIKTYKGITGLKTGSTDTAKYCLSATAERDGMELIAVVMAAPTTKERFQDAATLLDYGYANYALIRPEVPEIPAVKVVRGKVKSLPVVLKNPDFSVLSEKGAKGEIQTEVKLADDVQAPVSKGQTVGTITYTRDGKTLGEGSLVVTEGCEGLGFLDILSRLFCIVLPGKAA